jgi:sterol desaturase/sphingolipid hydroxylase (fatty acid hydroxylase superfamily)
MNRLICETAVGAGGLALAWWLRSEYAVPLLCFWCSFLGTGFWHLAAAGTSAYEQGALNAPRPATTTDDVLRVLRNARGHLASSLALAGLLPLLPRPAWFAPGVVADDTVIGWSVVIHSVRSLLITLALLELWFYHVHRLLHLPAFYRWHRQHHEFERPFALAALYGSTVEFLLLNVAAVFLGPWLTYMPMPLMCVYLAVVGADVAIGHSGHHPYATFHDRHHVSFKYNYGVFYLFDALYGTWWADPPASKGV